MIAAVLLAAALLEPFGWLQLSAPLHYAKMEVAVSAVEESTADTRVQRLAELKLPGLVNREVNLQLHPRSEVIDEWASPVTTLDRGWGDCEDYALLKMAVLRASGVPRSDLRIVVVEHQKEQHAVLAVRLGDEWRLLDNRRTATVRDTDARDYVPVLVIGATIRAYERGK